MFNFLFALICLSNFNKIGLCRKTCLSRFWLDLLLFYYVEIIQISNGKLSRFNIVVLEKFMCY